MGDTRLIRHNDRLHTITRTQLRQHMRHMRLHRRLRKHQLPRNLRILQTTRNQTQHLKLTRRQLLNQLTMRIILHRLKACMLSRNKRRLRKLRTSSRGSSLHRLGGRYRLGNRSRRGGRNGGVQHRNHMLQQAASRRWRNHRIAAVHRTDCLQQLLRRGVLQQETARTRTHRRIHVLINIEGREHDNAHPLILGNFTLAVTLQDAARRLQAVAVRHAHIHEDDLRRLPFRDHAVKNVNSRQSVVSLHDDLQVRLGVDEHAQAAAY